MTEQLTSERNETVLSVGTVSCINNSPNSWRIWQTLISSPPPSVQQLYRFVVDWKACNYYGKTVVNVDGDLHCAKSLLITGLHLT